MSAIRTYTGKDVDPVACTGVIDIHDIAHSLSGINRFLAHTSTPYSVAQHSIIVSNVLKWNGYPAEMQLQGLLHDATEAYLGDVVTPLKHLPFMSEYRVIEARFQQYIADQFQLPELEPIQVKWADRIALATEARDLMRDPDWEVLRGVHRLKERIVPLVPVGAELLFIDRYEGLLFEMGRSTVRIEEEAT